MPTESHRGDATSAFEPNYSARTAHILCDTENCVLDDLALFQPAANQSGGYRWVLSTMQ